MALKVHTRFSGGNARVLRVQADGELPEIEFAADPGGGSEALWFCFRVLAGDAPAGAPAPDKLKLTLRHFTTLRGAGAASACRPAYQPEGKGWFRANAGVDHVHPDGRVDVSWTIPYPAPSIEVAVCYPYGRDELDLLVRKCRGSWHEDEIGLTAGGHGIVRLSNEPGREGGHAAGVYLVARQHAGETPGSWVLDGLLDRFSREKRKPGLVWAVPLLDADGIVRGAYGRDSHPFGLERSWGAPPGRYEAGIVQQDLRVWARRCRPRLVLDLQSPGLSEADGIRCRPPAGEMSPDAQAWTHIFAEALGKDYAAAEFVRAGPEPASPPGAPRLIDYAAAEFKACALIVEIPYALCGATVMTQKQYRDAGRLLAKAILARLLGGSVAAGED